MTSGEEFVVLLPGADGEEALSRAEELRRGCAAATVPAAAVTVGGAVGPVGRTVGVGVAGLRGRPDGHLPDDTAEGLLRAADQALYEAKRNGRDRVVLATQARPGEAAVAHAVVRPAGSATRKRGLGAPE